MTTRKLLYNTDTQKLLPYPRADGGEIAGLESHLIPVTETILDDEEYDPATQRLEVSRTINLDARTVTVQRVAVDLSAQEIAERRRSIFPDAKRYQVREWLILQGITPEQVEAQIAAMYPDDATSAALALNRWREVEEIPRDHPLVAALGSALGFTAAQLDAEWANILNIR